MNNKAPCGCPGTPIIGNFVKCNTGCESDTFIGCTGQSDKPAQYTFHSPIEYTISPDVAYLNDIDFLLDMTPEDSPGVIGRYTDFKVMSMSVSFTADWLVLGFRVVLAHPHNPDDVSLSEDIMRALAARGNGKYSAFSVSPTLSGVLIVAEF